MTIEVRQMVIKSSIGGAGKEPNENDRAVTKQDSRDAACASDSAEGIGRIDLEAEAKLRYQYQQLHERSRER